MAKVPVAEQRGVLRAVLHHRRRMPKPPQRLKSAGTPNVCAGPGRPMREGDHRGRGSAEDGEPKVGLGLRVGHGMEHQAVQDLWCCSAARTRARQRVVVRAEQLQERSRMTHDGLAIEGVTLGEAGPARRKADAQGGVHPGICDGDGLREQCNAGRGAAGLEGVRLHVGVPAVQQQRGLIGPGGVAQELRVRCKPPGVQRLGAGLRHAHAVRRKSRKPGAGAGARDRVQVGLILSPSAGVCQQHHVHRRREVLHRRCHEETHLRCRGPRRQDGGHHDPTARLHRRSGEDTRFGRGCSGARGLRFRFAGGRTRGPVRGATRGPGARPATAAQTDVGQRGQKAQRHKDEGGHSPPHSSGSSCDHCDTATVIGPEGHSKV